MYPGTGLFNKQDNQHSNCTGLSIKEVLKLTCEMKWSVGHVAAESYFRPFYGHQKKGAAETNKRTFHGIGYVPYRVPYTYCNTRVRTRVVHVYSSTYSRRQSTERIQQTHERLNPGSRIHCNNTHNSRDTSTIPHRKSNLISNTARTSCKMKNNLRFGFGSNECSKHREACNCKCGRIRSLSSSQPRDCEVSE